MWSAVTGERLQGPLAGHTGAIWGISFSSHGLLATAGLDGTVRLWDPATGQSAVEPLTGHADGITHAAFHPNGHLLATSSDDCTTRLWAQPGLPAGHSRSVGARA
ncbi:WD40 repeat domain-containing protein [Streptomyces umbrinus]|uniref:WD40 repeat domain-containing protein n=1 Tax=Streptomyces umbrinus TaxID=67370 RepID=UPI00341FCB00